MAKGEKGKWHHTLPLRWRLCRWSHSLRDKGEGWQQILEKAGAYGVILGPEKMCWHVWRQHHCLPDSDHVGADVSKLWVCCGRETSLSVLTRDDRAPVIGWLCKVYSKTVFDCEMLFFQVATIASPGKKCNQPPKVTPTKQSLHFQQMLPAESSFPTSQLQLKKGLQQCPLYPVVPVLHVLDLKRGRNNFWAWMDMEYSNILSYPWQSSSGLCQAF